MTLNTTGALIAGLIFGFVFPDFWKWVAGGEPWWPYLSLAWFWWMISSLVIHALFRTRLIGSLALGLVGVLVLAAFWLRRDDSEEPPVR